MAKDFFDDEYEKQQQKEAERNQSARQSLDDWYGTPTPPPKTNNKPLYIVLLCVALVACIGLGWLLCFIFQSVPAETPQTDADGILDEVITYLQQNYYQDITDEEWTAAIEVSGTALMQTAGDRFCRLMSPQTYYDFNFPTGVAVSSDEVFGISFTVDEGIGMYVSSVVTDSAAFGKINDGDLVLKLTNMRTKSGSVVSVGGKQFDEIVFADWDSTSIRQVMAVTHSADFHILRTDPTADSGFKLVSVSLRRAALPKLNTQYNFNFVEFYFGSDCTNVSTESNKPSGATVSTETLRHLNQLPADTGYIRITEFMDYVDDNGKTVSASEEFRQAMELFRQRNLKHLVLDLKGNPGGNVQYVSEVAAMLITDSKLTDVQKAKVTDAHGNLLVTYLEITKPRTARQNQYKQSTYNQYFGPTSDVCDIAVWTDVNSASASELLTGCLRDYGTAVQMGTKTYGKGIAQTWEELPFQGPATDIYGNTIQYPWAVYYTCAKYYSPLGLNIHDVGYTPDKPYNNLSDYADLWQAVNGYWG